MYTDLSGHSGGISCFCMGTAWREVRDNLDFDKVIDMVKDVNNIGLEVCCTLGMLTPDQAQKLKRLQPLRLTRTSMQAKSFYDDIITTFTKPIFLFAPEV